MSDVTRRLDQWKAKYTSERAKSTMDAVYEKRQERCVAATVDLCAMEEQARQVLNAAGVHSSFYVPYLDVARQLWRLSPKRGIAGESFAMDAQVLLDKWAARGCNPDVLARIRTDVFNVAAPNAPGDRCRLTAGCHCGSMGTALSEERELCSRSPRQRPGVRQESAASVDGSWFLAPGSGWKLWSRWGLRTQKRDRGIE